MQQKFTVNTSNRKEIEHTGIVIPIPAALPLAQTNRLLVFILYRGGFFFHILSFILVIECQIPVLQVS